MERVQQSGFIKQMLKLALPISLQNMLTSCAGLVDTAMVVGLGNVATAAVGVAGRWTFMLNLFLFGFCSGSSALISQYWGARDAHSIRKTFGLAISCALGVALIYNLVAFLLAVPMMRVFTPEADVVSTAAIYLRTACFNAVFLSFNMLVGAALRSTEDVVSPLLCSGVSVVTNTVLNYILIYGKLGMPALGVQGAALATVISTALGSVLLFVRAVCKKAVIVAPLRELLDINKQFARKFFAVASPVIGNEALWAAGTNIYVMVLARQGSENYAGYTMYSSIEQLVFVFFVGMCHACAIMVGKRVGEGKLDEAYYTARRFMIAEPIVGVILGVLLILTRNPILGLLPIETEGARQVASDLLLIYACWMPVRQLPYIAVVGSFRAGGDTRTGLYYDLISVFLCGIPVVALLGMVVHVPFQLLVLSMFVAEDAIKLVLCIRRFRSRQWIRRLTMPGNNAYEK